MIIFSDLHLREPTEEICFKVLEEVYKLTLAEPDSRLVFLGDLWQLRYQVSVRLLNRLVDHLVARYHGNAQVEMIPGNHDQVTVAGDNALEVLGRLPNVRVWTEAGFSSWEDRWLAFVPYRKDRGEQAAQFIQAMDGEERPSIIFGHFGVSGAVMNSGRINHEDGLSAPVLTPDLPPIVLGHYHKPHYVEPPVDAHISSKDYGGVTYVGSPYQQSFGETGNECRVLRVRATKKGLVWKSIPLDVGAPRHFIVSWDGLGDPPPPPAEFKPGDLLRVDLKAPSHRLTDKKVIKALRKQLADATVNVIPEAAERDRKFETNAGESLQDAALRFLTQRMAEEDDGAGEHALTQRVGRLAVPLRRWAGEEVGA